MTIIPTPPYQDHTLQAGRMLTHWCDGRHRPLVGTVAVKIGLGQFDWPGPLISSIWAVEHKGFVCVVGIPDLHLHTKIKLLINSHCDKL